MSRGIFHPGRVEEGLLDIPPLWHSWAVTPEPLSLLADAWWPGGRSGQGRARLARRSEPLTARTTGPASSQRERGDPLRSRNILRLVPRSWPVETTSAETRDETSRVL